MSGSNLKHSNHPPVKKEAQKGSSADITPNQLKIVIQMYHHSIPPSTMSHMMTNLLEKMYPTYTILKLTKKCKEAMDVANGISLDLS